MQWCVLKPKGSQGRENDKLSSTTENFDCILRIGNSSRPKIMSEIRVFDSEMK